MAVTNLLNLEAFHDDDELNVVIETPKGSRNKYNYDEKLGLFRLGGVLTSGASFPFDFGFVPSTVGGDGDPLDVLVLMDEPAFAGCLVRTRLVGVIEAEQIEHFFVSYNQVKGKKFNPLGRFGPERARELVEEGMKQFRRSKGKRVSSK